MELCHRSVRSRRARLVLNQLEAREVPAGIVTVSQVGGHVVLIGDDFDNIVSVSMTTGANADVTFTPDATTTIDDLSVQGGGTMGQPVTLKVSMQDLHLTMKGGRDVFLVTDPNGLQMPGELGLDMGDGDNLVRIDTDGKLSVGDFSITAADGFDRVVLTAREAQSGLATGRRSHKPLKMSMGDGGFDVTMSNFQVPGSGISFKAGDSPLVGQGGGFGGKFTADGLTMDGGFSGSTGGGLCSFSFGATNMGSYGHGGGGGSGKVSVSFTNNTQVKGDVTISAAGGVAVFSDHSTFDKSMKVQKKWLPSNFRTSADVLLMDSPVKGGVSVSALGGSTISSVALVRSPVTGPVSVSNAGPNGSAMLYMANGACGPVSVQATGQGGGASATFDGACSPSSVSVKGTNSATLTLTGSLFAGPVGAPQPTGNVTVASRAGLARCDVSGGGGGAGGLLRAVDLMVSGYQSATVESDVQAAIRLAGDWTVTSQQFASIGDVNQDGTVDVAGAVTVSGVDMAAIQSGDSWTSGPVSVSSRMGPVITNFVPTTLNITGDFTNAGGDACIITIAPKNAGTLNGNVKVKGGVSDDNILIQDVDGLHDVVVDMGKGDDSFTLRKTFVLPHIIEASGRLSVSGGGGAGKVTFQDVHFRSTASVKLGAGADVVSIDGCVFDGAFGIDMGAGDDQILIGLLLNASGPVTFKAPVTMACGAGNDLLSLGVVDNPGITEDDNSRVVFGQGVVTKIDGGVGLNLFDPQAGHVDGLDVTKSVSNMTDPTP